MIAISNDMSVPLTFVECHNLIGSFHGNSYEKNVAADHYSAFLHTHPEGKMEGSFGAIAYSCEINHITYYVSFAWANPYKLTGAGLKSNTICGNISLRAPVDLKSFAEMAFD